MHACVCVCVGLLYIIIITIVTVNSVLCDNLSINFSESITFNVHVVKYFKNWSPVETSEGNMVDGITDKNRRWRPCSPSIHVLAFKH